MAGNSGQPGRTVTSKLAAILTAFTDGREYTLSELAMQTNLAVSTAHRLLNDLVRTSLLERQDGNTYRPGPTLRGLTHETRPATLRARGPFVVEDLASSLHTTARLGVIDCLEVAYIEKKDGPEPGTLFPNPARLPLHATAMGKALLAFESLSLVRLIVGCDLQRYTPRTLTCATELEHALQKVRTRGFAVVERELYPTVSTVALPVFDVQGRSIAAVEVDVVGAGPDAIERTLPALLTAARCLRRELVPPQRRRWSVEPPRDPAGRAGALQLQA